MELNKVNFVRKPTYEDLIPQHEFLIEKEIVINVKEFEDFIRNPLEDRKFIAENIEFMFRDGIGVYHVILVKSSVSAFGILVESEGTKYGRYCAYYPLQTSKNKY